MKAGAAISQRRGLFALLCLLLVLFFGCGAFLLMHFRHPVSVAADPTPLPIAPQQQRRYTSRYTETPVPSLPALLYTPGPSAEPSAHPTASPAPEGLLGGKYAWRFSDTEVLTDHTYSNKTISISWDMYRDEINYAKPVTFYVADVLLQDVHDLTTAFAKGSYSSGGVTSMENIAKNSDCIVAISGDFARWHENGLIVRNGEVYRQKRYTSDLCVLYPDGVMESYTPGTISL